MAEVVTQRTAPAEFIEAAGKTYLTDLQKAIGGLKAADLSTILGPQFIAGLDPLQQQAISKAGGLGAYEPYLKKAEGFSGPDAYKQFMSPYQKDVIDTTLAEYDVQAARGVPGLAASAISAGAFGGGREGVQKAVYGSESDRNRAALQAQLQQQGFSQAQQLAGQAFGQQMNLAQAAPAFASQQIAGLSTLGGLQQAQTQAGLAAQQQLLQAQSQQPIQAAQTLGSGIMGLISGYPGQISQTVQPTPSPLQTALSTGATLAGLYKGFSGL